MDKTGVFTALDKLKRAIEQANVKMVHYIPEPKDESLRNKINESFEMNCLQENKDFMFLKSYENLSDVARQVQKLPMNRKQRRKIKKQIKRCERKE